MLHTNLRVEKIGLELKLWYRGQKKEKKMEKNREPAEKFCENFGKSVESWHDSVLLPHQGDFLFLSFCNRLNVWTVQGFDS